MLLAVLHKAHMRLLPWFDRPDLISNKPICCAGRPDLVGTLVRAEVGLSVSTELVRQLSAPRDDRGSVDIVEPERCRKKGKL